MRQRRSTLLLAVGSLFFLALSSFAQHADFTGLIGRPMSIRHRLPTNHPEVTFEIDRDGGAVFYSSIQPFRGVAITPDGRNLYLGN